MAESKIQRDIQRAQDAQRRKAPWMPMYQALAEAFLRRKADFTHEAAPGDFLGQEEVFDNTGQFAAHLYASVCLSHLWPDAARTFNLVPVKQMEKMPGVEEFMRAKTRITHMYMDRPEAGLITAFMDHFLDNGIFGIGGVSTADGPAGNADIPLAYEAWDIKSMCVSENAQGYVDTIYNWPKMTVRQVMEKYGSGARPGDKVSARVKEMYDQKKYDDFVKVLIVIEPKKAEKGKKGYAAMKMRVAHIDVDNRTLMREEGQMEQSVHVGRQFKRTGEAQGRSSGMIALADANTLDAMTEAMLVAAEKQLDPPLGLLDEGRLGGTTVNTGAGALSVFNASGRLGNEKPIFPLLTVGDMSSSEKMLDRLEGKLMQAFFLDRLLDLNNKTMMTAYETSVRNRLRGEGSGSMFARQISEVITPTIRTSVNRLRRGGYYGQFHDTDPNAPGSVQRRKWRDLVGQDDIQVPEVIVKAVAAGLPYYEIEYISPAQRFMEAEKLNGAFTAADALVALEPVLPGIVDNVNKDEYARAIWKLAGAPRESLRTLDSMKVYRAELAQQQQRQQALDAGQQMADISAKSAQARAALGTTAK